jgi:hypothetical protein
MLRDAISMGAEDAHIELMELYEPNIVAVVISMIGEVMVVSEAQRAVAVAR